MSNACRTCGQSVSKPHRCDCPARKEKLPHVWRAVGDADYCTRCELVVEAYARPFLKEAGR